MAVFPPAALAEWEEEGSSSGLQQMEPEGGADGGSRASAGGCRRL